MKSNQSGDQGSMFSDGSPSFQPLAARMRPRKLSAIHGQEHLLSVGKPLREAIDASKLHSMILWGPPGTGKTTIARMISEVCEVHFQSLSAVLSGVKDIREAIDAAKAQRHMSGKETILFVDEVHRFNKSQQDAFLPFVEDGTIIFIGATTENPSFELNNALLSRARVYKLRSISSDQVVKLLEQAIGDKKNGLGNVGIEVDPDILSQLALAADGDGRKALNLLELASDLSDAGKITQSTIEEVLSSDYRRFDKGGDIFYEQISAMHKAVRGSSPDASLYWFARMIDGGCDPLYIARRVVRMASEDIGIADPRALEIALNAWQVQERLGSPEGELAIASAIVYLAVAAKSNAVYLAYTAAQKDAQEQSSYEVPDHLRNAPTNLLKELGYGAQYQYAHDFKGAYVAGESYFPEALDKRQYYEPVERGLEIKIQEKLAYLRKLDSQSEFHRYMPSKNGKGDM
ncbi:MAG: putative ATPase [Candidatus Azotimanducaceae bacterium]|jgi:putative ATPase